MGRTKAITDAAKTRDAEECFFTEEEIAACVDEGHRHGKRLCTHARCEYPSFLVRETYSNSRGSS